MPAYAIVVNVQKPRGICFIATPFAAKFVDLSDLIQGAANDFNLQSVRTDRVRHSPTFIQDIFDFTRSSKIIVAVCSPEEEGKLNPNVMYELGLAHALGKPIVIMTDNLRALPRDIDTYYALEYTDDEVENQKLHLQNKIKIEMGRVLQRVEDELTDVAWHQQGISVAKARHRMIVYPDFWDNFKAIIAFAKKIHQQIQAVDTGNIDQLHREAIEIASSPSVGLKDIAHYNDIWASYVRFYDTLVRGNFNQLAQAQSQVDNCFRNLGAKAEDEQTKAIINNCQDYYGIICRRLQSYLRIHQNLLEKYRGDFSSLRNPTTAADVYNQMREFSETTKDILIQADGLIRDLIDLIVEE